MKKIILTSLLLISVNSMADYSATYKNFGKTVCNLSVGTDDGRDLSPDDIFAMKDQNGKDLNQVPVVSSQKDSLGYIQMKSNVIVAQVSEINLEGQKTLRLGVDVPGTGPIFTMRENVNFEDVVTIKLDISNSNLAKKLGSIYDACDSVDHDCLSNVVYLTCGPQGRVQPDSVLMK